MTGNNVVFDDVSSIYSVIQQYDPYADNSFLIAMALTILFTLSMAYLGITANAKQIESLFPPPPQPQSDSNIPPRDSMPPPLDLIKSLMLWGCLYVICFVSYSLFSSQFVWSRNEVELVNRTFINSKVDLFIRIFLISLSTACLSIIYFHFIGPPNVWTPLPKYCVHFTIERPP